MTTVAVLLRHLTDKHWSQSVLGNAVTLGQYLQGVGSGADVASSGEQAAFEKMKRRVSRDQTLCIFDVGANKGQFLDLARSCLAGRRFSIHSFEPSRVTYDQLCQNNFKNADVTLNNFGLGVESGEFELFSDVPGSALASLTQRDLAHFGITMSQSERVQISTVDAYCMDHRIDHIDLLKIDVEGHELDVLNGATQMFRKSAIDMVTFEFGGCHIDTRTFVRDFFHFFQEHQMRISRITPSGYLCELLFYTENLEQFRTTNFLCYRS